MGRFHRHPDGTEHEHEQGHGHDVGDHSGYAETGAARVMVLENILSENDRVADENRRDLRAAGVRTVNLMSSPGAGKTTLLRRTLVALRDRLRIGVLEGDIATSTDPMIMTTPNTSGRRNRVGGAPFFALLTAFSSGTKASLH